MRLSSRRRREELLGEAFEQGIRHFDVARMYGLGAAEAELGRFAASRRGEISIATKFGIEPPSPLLARAQAPARAAMEKLPALKKALKRGAAAKGGGAEATRPPRRYDGELARRSLETSLRELGTEYVDCFFVHDPGPGDEVDLEGIGEACEELLRNGKIRAWGFSGEPDPCLGLAEAAGVEPVLQVRDDVFCPAVPPEAEPPAIGFGVLATALGRIGAHLASAGNRRRWSEATGCDCGDGDALAGLLLREALDRNRRGGVLLSTTKPARLGGAVAAARVAETGEEDTAAVALRRCVEADFPTAVATDA
jgi:D-threo-aldose 1-dehydrogenase